jgi:O-antigen/teichoic acid export membrane protein
MIIGFLMMPFLIHQYGNDRYGLWVLVLNFTGYLGLLNLGVGGSVIKYVAEFKAKNDQKSLNQICSSSLFLYLIAGLIAAVFALFIAYYCIDYFKIPNELLYEAKFVILIAGLQIASSIPLGVFSSYMRGMQRYDLIAYISVIILIIRTITIVFFVLRGYGLVTLALIHLFCSWLEGIGKIIYVYWADKSFRLHYKYVNKNSFKMVFDYSLFFFLYFISFRIIFAVDNLLIGYFLGTASITFYAIAHRLIEYIRLIAMGTAVFQPTVSHLQAMNQNSKNLLIMSIATKYIMIIALPIGASYIIVGRQFLQLWIGDIYTSLSYPVLIILTIGIIGNLTQHIAIQVLQGIAKHSYAAYAAILQAAISIILMVILLNDYGLKGVAIGKTVPMLFFNLLWIPWYTCKLLETSFLKFLYEALTKPLFAVIIYSVFLFIITKFIIIQNWMTFCGTIFLSIFLYVICASYLCFSKEERHTRFQQFRSAFNISR